MDQRRIDRLKKAIKEKFNVEPSLWDAFFYALQHDEPPKDKRLEEQLDKFLKNLSEQ